MPRIVEFVSTDAYLKALEAEKALVFVILSTKHLLCLVSLCHIGRAATKILTPGEWEHFPARREEARRARLAEEGVSLGEVVRRRAWRLAPEDLRARAGALHGLEEDEDWTAYSRLLAADEAAALRLRTAAAAEIAALAAAGRLRFARGGKDVTATVGAGWREGSAAGEADAFEAEAECHLLELVEAGLPEWAEWSRAEHFTPAEFRGPVAVLTEAPPDCLDGAGRYVEPGREAVEEAVRERGRAGEAEALRSVAEASAARVRAVLVRRAIIRVFGRDRGWTRCPRASGAGGDLAGAGRGLRTAGSDQQEPGRWTRTALTRRTRWAAPEGLGLPVIDLEQLEPDPEEVGGCASGWSG